MIKPRMEMPPNIQRTFAVPMFVFAMAKTSDAITAPTLPDAAEKPCAKPRTRVGKTSDGTMKLAGRSDQHEFSSAQGS